MILWYVCYRRGGLVRMSLEKSLDALHDRFSRIRLYGFGDKTRSPLDGDVSFGASYTTANDAQPMLQQ